MKQILFFIFLCGTFHMYGQQFEEITNHPFFDYYYGASDVGDVTGNGFQDILYTGAVDLNQDGNVDTTVNEFYSNNSGNYTSTQTFQETAVHLSAVKFIDMDNDGNLDLITTGLSYNDIVNYKHYRYRFNGTSFDLIETLPGRIYGSLDVFDFNHDGKQDYAINGIGNDGSQWVYDIRLFLNNGESFDEISSWVEGTQNGDFKVIDLNNDGLLDLVVIGFNADLEEVFQIYLNNEGSLELSQDFKGITGALTFADFDADGYLDMVAGGTDEEGEPYLAYFHNDGTGKFTEQVFEEEDVSAQTLDVGDLNNDGYYDFVVIGDDPDYNGKVKIYIYQPESGSFEMKSAQDTGLYNLGSGGDLKLLDYNNDGHLDVLMSGFDWESPDYESKTKLFKNTATEENLPPVPPTSLVLEQNDNHFMFSWDGADDDKTPVSALKYELKVGTEPDGGDVMKYVVNTPFWFLELASIPDNLYWSVKSIDASNLYSEPSEEATLDVQSHEKQDKISLYPNPAADWIYIDAEQDITSATIYSMDGRSIIFPIENNRINIETLSEGAYIALIQTQDGFSQSIKFIKE